MALQAARHVRGEFAQAVGVAAHLVVVPAEDLDVSERHRHVFLPASPRWAAA